MKAFEQPPDTFTVELVWDAGRDATAVAGGSCPCGGAPVSVGPSTGWWPAHHLTLAVAGSFMNAFLQLAAAEGVAVLGYVSAATLRIAHDSHSPPHLTLTPCVVVGGAWPIDTIQQLMARAQEASEICRLLKGGLLVNPDVRVVEETGYVQP